MKNGQARTSLLVLGGALLAAWMFRRRTRGYDELSPELRSPLWRLRTPSIGPTTLRLARLAPATACVEGVAMRAARIASADGRDITVYVYRPTGAAARGPAMLYTHGGGLVLGSAASYHAVVSAYARDFGIVMISAEYRLAPEHPFPVPLDDVHAAYLWILANAELLDIDTARLAVGGESAGGGLTAALAQRIRDEGRSRPVFQLLVYPMLDDRTTLRSVPGNQGQLFWTGKSNLFGWSSYLGRTPAEDYAPPYAAAARTADLSGLPPTWMGVGSLDLFHAEDVEYARRLRESGVPCELEIVDGAFHGFDMVGKSRIGRSFRGSIVRATRAALGLE